MSLLADVDKAMSLYDMILDCYYSTSMSEDDRRVVAAIENRLDDLYSYRILLLRRYRNLLEMEIGNS
jgi:hypothetical protein